MRKSLMMVDDSAELIEVAKNLFDPKEFLFVSAKDGSEALFKAQNQKFDVVVCDIKMPRMDGLTFIKEYRRLIKQETPILIYSGHLEELPPNMRDVKNLFRLQKPSQGYELLQKVRSLAGVSDVQVQNAKVVQRRFDANAFIFREGERGSDGFVIDEGEIELIKEFSDGSEIVLDVLSVGEFLGTWAPIDSQFRFCSARAKTAIALTEIPHIVMQKEFENKPAWVQALIKGKHQRLVNAYQRIKKQLKAS